MGFLVGYIVFF